MKNSPTAINTATLELEAIVKAHSPKRTLSYNLQERIHELIGQGADVNHVIEGLTTGRGITRIPTTLLCKALIGENAPLFTLLANAPNIKIDQPNLDGQTALHFAVAKGNVAAVKLLLDKKANPNHESHLENTPLDALEHCKADEAKPAIEALLRAHGAVPVARYGRTKTPVKTVSPTTPEHSKHPRFVEVVTSEGVLSTGNRRLDTGLSRIIIEEAARDANVTPDTLLKAAPQLPAPSAQAEATQKKPEPPAHTLNSRLLMDNGINSDVLQRALAKLRNGGNGLPSR